MLTNITNNSYSTYLSANRWYWSAPTQQRIMDVITESREVVATILMVLSHCYSDLISLLDSWLSYGMDAVVIVPCDNTEVTWGEVVDGLRFDTEVAVTLIGYWLQDMRSAVIEIRYNIASVITAIVAVVRM